MMDENTKKIIIPFGNRLIVLSDEELQAALRRGDELSGQLIPASRHASENEPLLTAEEISQKTGIPASWFLERARRGKIPFVRLGKYIRFKMQDIDKQSEKHNGHKARMALSDRKPIKKQGLISLATTKLPT